LVDIYNVFIAFTVLWFVAFSVISAYLFQVFGAAKWLQTLEFKIAVGDVLKRIGFADVSDFVVSPPLYLIWGLSLYFGCRMLATCRPRKDLRKLVSGEGAQRVLSRSVVMLCLTALLFVVIVVPGFYLALLSASLLKRVDPDKEFEYSAACHLSGKKMDVTVVMRNNYPKKSTYLKPIFVDWNKDEKAFRIDTGDMFWMSRKGFYFDPAEIRYYRLELPAPAQFQPGSTCTVDDKAPTKGFVPVKATGDANS
jgi:hypothetical protein